MLRGVSAVQFSWLGEHYCNGSCFCFWRLLRCEKVFSLGKKVVLTMAMQKKKEKGKKVHECPVLKNYLNWKITRTPKICKGLMWAKRECVLAACCHQPVECFLSVYNVCWFKEKEKKQVWFLLKKTNLFFSNTITNCYGTIP